MLSLPAFFEKCAPYNRSRSLPSLEHIFSMLMLSGCEVHMRRRNSVQERVWGQLAEVFLLRTFRPVWESSLLVVACALFALMSGCKTLSA